MLHPRKILSIYRKDLKDAVRDARVLMALVMPLGLGIFYNLIFNDDESRPEATVVYASAGPTTLPDALRDVAGGAVRLTFRSVDSPGEARGLVTREDADIALILPAEFDAAVRRGDVPQLIVIEPEAAGFAADFVAASLEEALRQMAGQRPPAAISTETIPATEVNATRAVFDQLGVRRWLVLSMAIFLVGMVSVYAVPVILTEEAEKGTLDAVNLIATYADVIVAKALVGLTYLAVELPLMLALTQLWPAEPLAFAAGMALLSVSLVGLGLLLGGLFRSVTQLNNWSGVALMLVLFPVFIVGLPVPEPLQRVAAVLPTGHAARLAVNSVMGEAAFAHPWRSYLVIGAWGVLAYALLLWRLSRREA